MTREEAIKELKILKEEYWDDDGYGHETKQYDDTMLALDMAMKALEQEPKDEELEELLESLQKANATNAKLIKLLDGKQEPCKEMFDDWHEAPSYAMTLEQAREAVHELRKEAVNLRREASEGQQDHAILKTHSDGANEVLDRIKEAREEIAKGWYTRPANRYEEGKKDRSLECLQILDELIEEVDG